MKKLLLSLIGLTFLLPLHIEAQVGKQVVVTKSYIPEVAEATKPLIVPDMTDTVKIRPEIDYNIIPRALNSSYTAQTFRPASVTYWEFNRPSPYYLKLGVGYPWQSEADLYLSTQHADIGYAMLYLNHEGQYDKILNDADLRERALGMDNRIGVAAGRYLGRQILEGEIYYDNRLRHRYGASDPSDRYMVGSLINFGEAGLDLRIGHDIVNREKVDFDVRAFTRYFYDNSKMPTPDDFNQIDGGGAAKIRFRWGSHRLGFNLHFEGRWGVASLSSYDNMTFGGGVRYSFSSSTVEAEVGANYLRASIAESSTRKGYNYILPYAHLNFNLGDGAFVPFIELDGEMEAGDFRSLSRENPYLKSGLRLNKNTVNYNLRVGAAGEVAGKFHYRLTLGVTCSENARYWYGVNFLEGLGHNFLQFGLKQARRNQASVSMAIGWRPTSGLELSLDATAYHYEFLAWESGSKLGGGLPALISNLKIEYAERRFKIGASAHLESARNWTNLKVLPSTGGEELLHIEPSLYHVPVTVDLRCWFDLRLSQSVTLYLEGRNLANARLYDWANYPLQGIGGMVGVKMTF